MESAGQFVIHSLFPLSLQALLSPPLLGDTSQALQECCAEGAVVWRWVDPQESMLKWVPQEQEPWGPRDFSKILLLSDFRSFQVPEASPS